jgi:hypothetical protein
MRIEIVYQSGYYQWKLYDVSDGIDEYEGMASSLGCAMEQIIVKQTENARHYATH